jgi:acyl-CoA synthetase (AMP-forming)/AMP-acid ligase II
MFNLISMLLTHLFIENKSIAKQESIYFRVLIPKYHIFVDSFPRTASGKVAKKLLKEDVFKSLLT